MHAQYVRVWFVAGLVSLVLAPLFFLARLAPSLSATLAVAGVCYLALALALGLLPAFARRDWPSPVFGLAGVGLGALALPLAWNERAFTALLGASLVVGAAQPLALIASPRWPGARERDAFRVTDGAALGGVLLALAANAVGGMLLIALPRGLPSAAFAILLLGGALPAAMSALLFVLPRHEGRALPLAILGGASITVLALAGALFAAAFILPMNADFRWPTAGVALGFALCVATLARAPRGALPRALLAASFALAVLAALALVLATLYGAPNALLPVALFAHVALATTAAALALTAAAPLLLPGKPVGERWMRWAPAIGIAALFLLTPAIQYGRPTAPAALAFAAGAWLLCAGLAPLARAPRAARSSKGSRRMRGR